MSFLLARGTVRAPRPMQTMQVAATALSMTPILAEAENGTRHLIADPRNGPRLSAKWHPHYPNCVDLTARTRTRCGPAGVL